MTEYERGFLSTCLANGLTERQAGSLCKIAAVTKRALFSSSADLNRGAAMQDAQFFADMGIAPDSPEAEAYRTWVESKDGGELGTWLGRNFGKLFSTSATTQERGRREQAKLQQQWNAERSKRLNERETNRANALAFRIQEDRMRRMAADPGTRGPAQPPSPAPAPASPPPPAAPAKAPTPTASSPFRNVNPWTGRPV